MNKPTVASVNSDLNDLSRAVEDHIGHCERSLADAASSYAGLRKELNDHRGTLGNNRVEHARFLSRLQAHEKKLGKLFGDLDRLKQRFDVLIEHPNEGMLSGLKAELGRLNEKSDAYAITTQKEIDAFRVELDEVTGRVDVIEDCINDHEVRLDGHDSEISELGSRIGIVGEAAASANARIDVLFRNHSDMPRWVLPVGIMLGVLAGLWWNSHDWTHTAVVGDIESSVTNVNAETWWAAVLAGLVVMLIVTAILGLIFRRSHDTDTSASASAAARAGARPAPTVPSIPPAPPADHTPSNDSSPEASDDTRVLPAAAAPPHVQAAAHAAATN